MGDNATQHPNDPLTNAQNGADEQRHESRAQRRTRERACKGSMAPKKRQEKTGKRKAGMQSIPHGERNALLDRRNASFAARVKAPPMGSIAKPGTSSTGPLTGIDSHGASTSSSMPEYTVRSEGNTPSLLSLCPLTLNPQLLV